MSLRRSHVLGNEERGKMLLGVNQTLTSYRTTTTTPKKETSKDKPLDRAPPPWHSVAFVACITALSLYQCVSAIHSLDKVAVLDTFTHRVFPEYVSLALLGWVRLAIAILIWVVFVSTVTSDGWIQTTRYRAKSKLQSGVPIVMKGSRTLFPFTAWCWILLGISFTSHALIALTVAYNDNNQGDLPSTPLWMLRAILLIWETTAPCAFLVSAVIRYVIWDMVLQGGPERTVQLKHPRNLMSHNMNSIFVVTEICLLGGLPVRLSEVYLGCLYGSLYIVIAWSLTRYWTSQGPHFLYFFLDTTLGYTTTISIAALTATLCLFYALLSVSLVALNQLTAMLPDNSSQLLLLCHIAFVLGVASLVCRFHD
ncbi:expressed unknown protein [Seminavis robusta]|uniref:Uncharacterized protein n=1 Tax=Seminavis robusta TaxID=568900 RepID=A0A9N8H2H4_9STRA|nr:expressed unknown protein [Seminavis robusta]|eukprot:Sro19_g013480.1 n/a (367) ;mRNA; r:90075-91175